MRPAAIPAAALAGALLLAPPGAGAATFTSFWALGDSLSDPGNLFGLTGGLLPPSPPYAGRASNGPVWAELVAGDFAAKGLATGNFAYAFARAIPNDDTALGLPVQVPDLPDQVAAFDAASGGRLGARPVVALWFGANDLFGAIGTGDPGVVTTTAIAAAGAVIEGIVDLAALGVRDVLVFNLPPLDLVPAFRLLQPAAAPLAGLGSLVFNAALSSGIDGLFGLGLEVATVDIDAALRDVIADPASYGLSDPFAPCFVSPSLAQPPAAVCSEEELATKVFFDAVHPTTAVHAVIADLARAEVAPVPLPPALAGLGAALLALLAVGRRARRAPLRSLGAS